MEHDSWRYEEVSLAYVFPTRSLPSNPTACAPVQALQGSPNSDLSAISTPLLFFRNVIVISLPTPTSLLVFLLFAMHVLGLKRPSPGTQGAGHLGGGGFLFGQSDCQHHSFPHWMGPSDVTFPPWVLGVLPAELPLLPLGGCGGIRWPVGVHPFKKPTWIK